MTEIQNSLEWFDWKSWLSQKEYSTLLKLSKEPTSLFASLSDTDRARYSTALTQEKQAYLGRNIEQWRKDHIGWLIDRIIAKLWTQVASSVPSQDAIYDPVQPVFPPRRETQMAPASTPQEVNPAEPISHSWLLKPETPTNSIHKNPTYSLDISSDWDAGRIKDHTDIRAEALMVDANKDGTVSEEEIEENSSLRKITDAFIPWDMKILRNLGFTISPDGYTLLPPQSTVVYHDNWVRWSMPIIKSGEMSFSMGDIKPRLIFLQVDADHYEIEIAYKHKDPSDPFRNNENEKSRENGGPKFLWPDWDYKYVIKRTWESIVEGPKKWIDLPMSVIEGWRRIGNQAVSLNRVSSLFPASMQNLPEFWQKVDAWAQLITQIDKNKTAGKLTPEQLESVLTVLTLLRKSDGKSVYEWKVSFPDTSDTQSGTIHITGAIDDDTYNPSRFVKTDAQLRQQERDALINTLPALIKQIAQ